MFHAILAYSIRVKLIKKNPMLYGSPYNPKTYVRWLPERQSCIYDICHQHHWWTCLSTIGWIGHPFTTMWPACMTVHGEERNFSTTKITLEPCNESLMNLALHNRTVRAAVYNNVIGMYDSTWGGKELLYYKDNTRTTQWTLEPLDVGLVNHVTCYFGSIRCTQKNLPNSPFWVSGAFVWLVGTKIKLL